MKRILVIVAIVFLAFVLEFFSYNCLGRWFKPELMLLVVVFFNLFLGIRYSLIAAVVAGLLKDSSAIVPPGMSVFVYVSAAYVTTYVRHLIYQPGSRFARATIAFLAVTSMFCVDFLMRTMWHDIHFTEALSFVFMPQALTTMIAATFVFELLRDVSVALRLK